MAKETVVCSQKVADAIKAFNNCDSYDEQLEVLDLLCDVMWKTTYRAIVEKYVEKGLTQNKNKVEVELKELRTIKGQLESENEELKFKVKELSERFTKKSVMKGLLTIINNIKHYLGDDWNTLFPGGMIEVNKFLAVVDCNQCIIGTDTWTQYETKDSK